VLLRVLPSALMVRYVVQASSPNSSSSLKKDIMLTVLSISFFFPYSSFIYISLFSPVLTNRQLPLPDPSAPKLPPPLSLLLALLLSALPPTLPFVLPPPVFVLVSHHSVCPIRS
jgi:hypothetical protein